MKPTITTPTPIKPITTKETFTSTAIPIKNKTKFHSTLNTILKYFPKTNLKINIFFFSKATTLIKNTKQVTTKKE